MQMKHGKNFVYMKMCVWAYTVYVFVRQEDTVQALFIMSILHSTVTAINLYYAYLMQTNVAIKNCLVVVLI